jgi:hypothetical protein
MRQSVESHVSVIFIVRSNSRKTWKGSWTGTGIEA